MRLCAPLTRSGLRFSALAVGRSGALFLPALAAPFPGLRLWTDIDALDLGPGFNGLDPGRHVIGERLDLDGLAQQFLDVLEVGPLIALHQGYGLSCRARACRAPDTVDVLLGHIGYLVVDDVGDLGDVDTARGHVGGDQDIHLAVGERGQGALALPLRAVAVDR